MKDFRLYVITGEEFHPTRGVVEVMEEAIQGGADIIQLRDKTNSKRVVLDKARKLRELTRKYDVPFIVNDHIDIALAVDADGIHLGQDDMPLHLAREIVGKDKIIGISTHRIQEAREAEQGGADYIGAGPIFPTNSKSDVVDPVTTSYLDEVVSEISIPFVAIGGIKLHNVADVVNSGANRICVISEVVGSGDVKGTCEMFIQKIGEKVNQL
ncbi:thiamine phosphate synthase [Guptibacillus hwajinpoensis]|uniref:Thiamine-phosphate synthase n=1 Tax=Guptibacillus hwajinpoensis TaxID=208199 RepID=A0ABU0K0I7_9BACL|nr:thiamine phosphate synthase [Alkalihalobacillus hemicentroti]MDQ0481662.1 thiamine-phosphate pyrophosphorylase [Alkalihalobacillus hemicentroti]